MRHKYSSEEIEFLKNNVKGISAKELTDRFNKYFGCNVTIKAIVNRKSKYNLKSGVNSSWFKKGFIPYNKGTKGLAKASSGSFKKGNIPKHTKKILSERINKDNYIEIKIAQPNKWKLKHRVIYEEYYNIKISHKDVVIFLDGNKRNFDINNLKLISHKEQLVMARNRFKSNNPEITKSYVALAKVMNKISEIKNHSRN